MTGFEKSHRANPLGAAGEYELSRLKCRENHSDSEMRDVGWLFIVGGIVLLLVGAGFLLAPRFPWLGNLPGDITVNRPGVSFRFPIVTSLLVSFVLTILLNLAWHLFRR